MDRMKVQQLLKESLNLEKVHVNGQDRNYEVIAIDIRFSGMTSVKRQQLIYFPLIKYFQNNDIHSVSIKTFTPDEWVNYSTLNCLSGIN
nr:BolA family protein [Candidatus Photodesmus katoptron]